MTNSDNTLAAPGLFDYLQKILTARVYDVAIESALEPAAKLSARLGNRVLLKREDTQPVFSFKLRGAYNKMARLTAAELARGVICASAGNHAQGVALAAQRLGCRALIVMPTTTPAMKIDAVRARGAEVMLHGESYYDAYLHARELSVGGGPVFVHPFDDPDVIAGQGTIAMELLRQHQRPIDAVFVSIGGGGLIAGIAAYIKAVRPEIRVIGVQTEDSDAMIRSVRNGRRTHLEEVGLFSDGTAVKMVGEETFRLCRALVDDYITVDTDAVCAAIKDVFEDTRSILEPAGALGVAAIKQYVAKTGARDQTLIAVTIPEERGSFRRLCELIGPRSLTEFNYRISDKHEAHVFVGLATRDRSEAAKLATEFSEHGFPAVDLTDDELSKEHVRHMVGGRTRLAHDERLYRFDFPEKPGALMRFLAEMRPEWNISLFHYRNQGADFGRVLIGLQFPAGSQGAFEEFLSQLDYPCVDETANPAYRLFLK
jgi:threonine dehydratase